MNKLNNLYHVKGYDWEAQETHRYIVTAATSDDAVAKVREYDRNLSDVCCMHICRTPDELFLEI